MKLVNTLVGLIILASAATAFAANSRAEQAKKEYETRLVAPCQGKKEGDQVQITSPRGKTYTATCKMTAEINMQ